MSDEIRVSRPSPQISPVMSAEAGPQTGDSSKMPWIILIVVVLVIAVLGVLFRGKLFGGRESGKAQTAAGKPSGYQAVFLTNGQVYFGKLTNAEAGFATMNDIYYLQVIQPPLQGQQQPGQTQAAQSQPQISLVKLGSELHGPVDEMKINRDQILFYEDLKEDGQVVTAIKNYKANPPAAQPVK